MNPGYSGSPLLDTSGNMVALNTAFAFSRALSIPANRVREIAEKLKRDGRVRHAYLGVTLDPIPLPQDVARVSRSHEGRDYGLMVLSVSDESPAKSAGLAIGDVLMAFDEQQVSSYTDLRKLLKENAIGKTAKISVLRGGKISDFEITPADDEQIAQ
ncbi:MAG TPA: PDZ domain-containing protein [Nitrososphaerales archaeon]|nr:PDZ domain-containing protein [Nitrososphaerales archaeon]